MGGAPHPWPRQVSLTTCSTEAPFRRMMASVKSGLSARVEGWVGVSRIRVRCHKAPLYREQGPFYSPPTAPLLSGTPSLRVPIRQALQPRLDTEKQNTPLSPCRPLQDCQL